MFIKPLLLLSVAALFVSGVFAEEIVLKNQHPTEYIIKKGDTLWHIASRFLRDPWRWPDIWHVNPQIQNPHLIYPGDVVVLTFKDGKPQLELRRKNTPGRRTIKLSPRVHQQPIARAIPTIPLDAIQQFLSKPHVVTEEELAQAPYIVSSLDEHLIAGSGDKIYVRGIVPGSSTRYTIVRPGKIYRNPDDSSDILGYEAIYIGDALVKRFSDPSTLKITHSERETLVADRLIPASNAPLDYSFLPHAPEEPVSGKIIAVVDGVSRVGQFQVVTINLGHNEGLEKGHMLAVYQAGITIRDPLSTHRSNKVTLPDERSGYLMVFRIFDRLSYALVMSAKRSIRVLDTVKGPA